MDPVKERRRGAALELAILDVAWMELCERGYDALTMDGVAKRAGTSRSVLHRRWPSRLALAIASLGRYLALNPIAVPDLGDIRTEMTLYLRGLADRARPDLLRLLLDIGDDLATAGSSLAEIRAAYANDRIVRGILDRAAARQEIDPRRLTPRIVALPIDLLRHDMLMMMRTPSDDSIREIVDEIFLPLVRRQPAPSGVLATRPT